MYKKLLKNQRGVAVVEMLLLMVNNLCTSSTYILS